MESYNFLLFPIGNKNNLTDSGWEIIGSKFVFFDKAKDVLLSKEFVKQVSPDFLWSFASPECYFEFNDGSSIIEIQLNGGKMQKEIREISVRIALCNPDGTYEKTLVFLKDISEKLNLNVLDMRLSKILNFNDNESLKESSAMFSSKRDSFLGKRDER